MNNEKNNYSNIIKEKWKIKKDKEMKEKQKKRERRK